MTRLTAHILAISLIALAAIVSPALIYGSDQDEELEAILDPAEGFFIALNQGEYEKAWNFLSNKSRTTIINDVFAAYKKFDSDVQRESIVKDFEDRGLLFRKYWSSFAGSFDTSMILKDSLWEMGEQTENDAEIALKYIKTQGLTKLRMYRESGAWKVGLVETFWARKNITLLQRIFEFVQ